MRRLARTRESNGVGTPDDQHVVHIVDEVLVVRHDLAHVGAGADEDTHVDRGHLETSGTERVDEAKCQVVVQRTVSARDATPEGVDEHRTGAVLISYFLELVRDLGQSLIPADALEFRLAAFADAFQRVQDAIFRIGNIARQNAFAADVRARARTRLRALLGCYDLAVFGPHIQDAMLMAPEALARASR